MHRYDDTVFRIRWIHTHFLFDSTGFWQNASPYGHRTSMLTTANMCDISEVNTARYAKLYYSELRNGTQNWKLRLMNIMLLAFNNCWLNRRQSRDMRPDKYSNIFLVYNPPISFFGKYATQKFQTICDKLFCNV